MIASYTDGNEAKRKANFGVSNCLAERQNYAAAAAD